MSYTGHVEIGFSIPQINVNKQSLVLILFSYFDIEHAVK